MALEVTPPTPFPFLNSGIETFGGIPALIGLPDGASEAIRAASQQLESYSPRLNRDLSDHLTTDYGDLSLPSSQAEDLARHIGDACQAILSTSATPVFLGGTHALTPGAVRAALNRFPDLAVLQINAHADLCQERDGNRWHQHCAMQRVLDRIPKENLVSLGVRSGTREEFQEISDDLERLTARPVYLSIDLSVFDPAFMPWISRPEPGGLDWNAFADLLAKLPWNRIKACDLVGLTLGNSSGKHSALLAAKALREILLSLS